MRFLLLIIGVIFMGCTAKKLVVKNSDSIIHYQITKRIPLYSAQKQQLSHDINKFLNTHKKEAQELLSVLEEIELGPNPQIDTIYKNSESIYKKIITNFSIVVSRQLANLDSKQQKDFIKNLQDENKKISNKTTANKINEVQDKFIKFFGSITKEQKEIFHSYASYYSESRVRIINRRNSFISNFESLYRTDHSQETRATQLQTYISSHLEEYLNTNKNLEITKKIIPTLRKDQVENFKKKIEEIKEMINYYIQTEY